MSKKLRLHMSVMPNTRYENKSMVAQVTTPSAENNDEMVTVIRELARQSRRMFICQLNRTVAMANQVLSRRKKKKKKKNKKAGVKPQQQQQQGLYSGEAFQTPRDPKRVLPDSDDY